LNYTSFHFPRWPDENIYIYMRFNPIGNVLHIISVCAINWRIVYSLYFYYFTKWVRFIRRVENILIKIVHKIVCREENQYCSKHLNKGIGKNLMWRVINMFHTKKSSLLKKHSRAKLACQGNRAKKTSWRFLSALSFCLHFLSNFFLCVFALLSFLICMVEKNQWIFFPWQWEYQSGITIFLKDIQKETI